MPVPIAAERSAGLILSFAEWRPAGVPPEQRAQVLKAVDELKRVLMEAAHELAGLAAAHLARRAFAEDDFGDVIAHYIDSASMTAIKNWVDQQHQTAQIMGSGSMFAGGGVAKPVDPAPWESAQKQWGGKLITGLLQQQAQAINESIASGIKDGLSREQIMHRLLRDVPSQLMPEWRARLISQTECLEGSAPVDGAKAVAVYRRWYDGHLIKVTTEGGHKLAGTTNHPVLTLVGWKGMGELSVGDELVSYSSCIQANSLGDPNIDDVPSSIAELFESLAGVMESGAEREICLDKDFHGDGQQGYVDIARANSVLELGGFAALDERIGNAGLSPSQLAAILFFAESYARVERRKAERIGVSPDGNGARLQSGFDAQPADAKKMSNGIDAHPGFIQPDRIIHIDVLAFSGHVYNLTTTDGYFVSDGLITGNTIRTYNSTSHKTILEHGGEYVEWLDGQKAACESCKGLHHRIIPLKPNLPPSQQPYFYDPIRGFTVQHPPLHPGCRCTIVSATEEDYVGQDGFEGGQLVYPDADGPAPLPMPTPKAQPGHKTELDKFLESGMDVSEYLDNSSFETYNKLAAELKLSPSGSYAQFLNALEAKKAEHSAGAIESIVATPPITSHTYPATLAGKFKEWWDNYPDHSITGLKALQQFAKAQGVPFQQISKALKAEGYEIGHLTGSPQGVVPEPTTIKIKVPGVKAPKPSEVSAGLKAPAEHGLADRPQSYWDDLKKESGPQGSNPGGIFVGPDGVKYYLKQYSNPLQGQIEIAAQQFYAALGIGVPAARMITVNGVSFYASELIQGAKSMTAAEMKAYFKKHPEEAARLHVGSIITQNWDVVGLSYDNLMLGPNGKLLVIDTGGAFIFRAQGGSKPFSITADEFDSLLNPQVNKQTADVFGKLYSKPEAIAAAKAAVEHYRKYIDDLVRFLPPGSVGVGGLTAKLDDLWMKLEMAEKRAAVSTMKFPDFVASHELDLVRAVGARIMADPTIIPSAGGKRTQLGAAWLGSSDGTMQNWAKAQLASYTYGISAQEAWAAEIRRRGGTPPEGGWESLNAAVTSHGWTQQDVLSIFKYNQQQMALKGPITLYRGFKDSDRDGFIAKIQKAFDSGDLAVHDANWIASWSTSYAVAKAFAGVNAHHRYSMVIKTEVPPELIFGNIKWLLDSSPGSALANREKEYIVMGTPSGFNVNPANTEIWNNGTKKYVEQEEEEFKPMNPNWKPRDGERVVVHFAAPDQPNEGSNG